jgi:hypothetical protein
MLKTISAAVLAVSMIAAPALATGAAKVPVPSAGKTAQAPASKQPEKARVLNANAKMHRHHYRHHHMSAVKGHSKVSLKHASIPAKRG